MWCPECNKKLQLVEYERIADDGKPLLAYECDHCEGIRVELHERPVNKDMNLNKVDLN